MRLIAVKFGLWVMEISSIRGVLEDYILTKKKMLEDYTIISNNLTKY